MENYPLRRKECSSLTTLTVYALGHKDTARYELHNIQVIYSICDDFICGVDLNHASYYNDVIMGAIASQITSLTIVYSIVYSDADQRKHQSSASLAFVTGEFPTQMASYAENVSIWWRHHPKVWPLGTTPSQDWHIRFIILWHYSDVITDAMASQITGLTIVYSIVYSDADHRKHQSSAPLAFVCEFPAQMASNTKKCFHLMTSSYDRWRPFHRNFYRNTWTS